MLRLVEGFMNAHREPQQREPQDHHQETAAVVSASPGRFVEADDASSMIVRNPAPDASPPSSPAQSRTFSISC